MGFEETEEIGPDGKAHVISEKSFGGPQLAPKALTPTQKAQQKALHQEMEAMAKDMGKMFANGDFGFAPAGGRASTANDAKYQQDLFNQALKTFQTAHVAGARKGAQALSSRATNTFPAGVDPSDNEEPKDQDWEMEATNSKAGKGFMGMGSSQLWMAGLGAVGVLVLGFFALRFYKTHMMYRPVGADESVEQLPFRSL